MATEAAFRRISRRVETATACRKHIECRLQVESQEGLKRGGDTGDYTIVESQEGLKLH